MLVLADDLAGRLEASTPLGTNYPCLSASCVFLQHRKQCNAVAAFMAPGSPQRARIGFMPWLLAGAHLGSDGSPVSIDQVPRAFCFLLAGLDQRFVPTGNMDAGV